MATYFFNRLCRASIAGGRRKQPLIKMLRRFGFVLASRLDHEQLGKLPVSSNGKLNFYAYDFSNFSKHPSLVSELGAITELLCISVV